MVRHTKALESLKAGGYRLTPQRVMVLAAMAEHQGHLGVEEILVEVHQAYPYIDVATVYRTLQLLKRLHIVTEIDSPDGTRYEFIKQDLRHHHMVCETCGAAFDLPPQYLDELKTKLVREVGFEPHMEHFTISGLCSRCAAHALSLQKGAPHIPSVKLGVEGK